MQNKIFGITEKKRKKKILLETVSEREREENTEDRMGREIEKVNGMVEPTMWGWGA